MKDGEYIDKACAKASRLQVLIHAKNGVQRASAMAACRQPCDGSIRTVRGGAMTLESGPCHPPVNSCEYPFEWLTKQRTSGCSTMGLVVCRAVAAVEAGHSGEASSRYT